MKSHEIMLTARNANDAMNLASGTCIDVLQNWDTETTQYLFDDGSVLSVSGPQVNAYTSLVEAAKADV